MNPSNKKRIFFYILGLMFCVIPPVLATLEHFPIWVARGGEAIVSGLTVILLFISILPLKRYIFAYLKSPSAWVLWLCVYLASSLLSSIIDDVASIALIAFPSNLIGYFFFRISKKYKKSDKEETSKAF